jgi:hypothetical protein
VLRRHFPHLLARYRALRENGGAFSPEVVSAIMDRFREAREEVGLADDSVSDECDVSRRSGTGWLFEA